MSEKILITGGTGFIGSHLADELPSVGTALVGVGQSMYQSRNSVDVNDTGTAPEDFAFLRQEVMARRRQLQALATPLTRVR